MISENRLMAIAALLTISVVALTGYAVSLEAEPSLHGTIIEKAPVDAALSETLPDQLPPEGDPQYYEGDGRSGPVTIVVTSARTVEPQAADQPSLVTVRMDVTMHGDDNLYLTPYFFRLAGSDGVMHIFQWSAGFSMPESIGGGDTAPVTISFQVPPGVTPQQVVYDDILYKVSVDLTGV